MNTKIKWLRDKLSRLDMQGMMITNPVNIKYLTGIDAEGVLLLTRRENVYITDGRYLEAVQSTLTIDDDIIVYDMADVSKEDCENFFTFCENVGFEENNITYASYKECMHKYLINNFMETENMIEKQRMIKDEKEIAAIQKACQITDDCFSFLLNFIQIGKTEKEIAFAIEKFFLEKGAEGVAFDTIVASGENSSKPHAIPSQRKIRKGDAITIDFGCRYQGYCSDMTRTIFVGEVSQKQKEVYDLVLKNQIQTLEDLKEGANLKLLSRMVEGDFKLHDYSLIHSLGHGVGLQVHELPYYSLKNDVMLKENMVVTVEPGIYLPNQFGVRIEDTVLITKSGCINLTKSEKTDIVIEGM